MPRSSEEVLADAQRKFWEALGDSALRVAHEINSDANYVQQLADFAADRLPLATLEDVAKWLKLSMSTMYQSHEEWGIPGRRLGKQLRFRWPDVIAWFKSRETCTKS